MAQLPESKAGGTTASRPRPSAPIVGVRAGGDGERVRIEALPGMPTTVELCGGRAECVHHIVFDLPEEGE